MPDVIMIILVLLCLSPVILPILVYCGYRAYKNHQKGWLFIVLLTVVLYIGFPAFHLQLIPGTDWYFDQKFTQQITGRSFVLGQPLHVYETDRYFNGDGYSIFIYELSDEVVAKFEDDLVSFMDFPKKDADRREWQIQTWQRQEIASEEEAIFDFALQSAPEALERLARSSLKNPTTYYAYLFKDITFSGNDNPTILNIDMYILDLEGKLLYIINHNT